MHDANAFIFECYKYICFSFEICSIDFTISHFYINVDVPHDPYSIFITGNDAVCFLFAYLDFVLFTFNYEKMVAIPTLQPTIIWYRNGIHLRKQGNKYSLNTFLKRSTKILEQSNDKLKHQNNGIFLNTYITMSVFIKQYLEGEKKKK